MRVQIITKFNMQWVKGYQQVFGERGWFAEILEKPFVPEIPDIRLFMWCDQDTFKFINNYPQAEACKNIVFVRRYEYYTNIPEYLDWSKVSKIICVNHRLANGIEKRTGIKPEVIFNGVWPEDWTYEARTFGPEIAIVGYVNHKKNLPMALQILKRMPEEFRLHIAGQIQDWATADYISHLGEALGLKERVRYCGHIKDVNAWLENKNFILSCSITEGNPNNVIEAMAKGIKPVVHNWPGSERQFSHWVFNTIDDAVEMMTSGEYDSPTYRKTVEENFGRQQYEKVADLIEEVMNG